MEPPGPPPAEERIREWLQVLCRGGHRVSGSPECRAAALEIRRGMEAAGLAVGDEEFAFHPSHPTGLILHYAVFILAALLTLRGAPLPGLLLAGVAMASAYGSETGRWDLLLHLTPRRRGVNIVGHGNPGGTRRLIVMAHYDGTRAGRVFNPRVTERFGPRVKGLPFLLQSPFLPLNLGILGVFLSPLLTLAGAALPATLLALYGILSLAIGSLLMADWAVAPPIPAANDNGTGVAAMLAAAPGLQAPGLEVWLVATDAEELGLKGATAFCHRHRQTIRSKPTLFLNLESVGCGRLCTLSKEGGYVLPLGLAYPPAARRALEEAARRQSKPPLPVEMAPVGTDAQILLRRRLQAITLIAFSAHAFIENYHWPTDTPENVDTGVVREAVEWTRAIAQTWAEQKA
ncbi:MAG: M28 family peptidase [Euryarchaeota archaeon]|nr:M28 family peptidase [Euryarchaeota archaeon]